MLASSRFLTKDFNEIHHVRLLFAKKMKCLFIHTPCGVVDPDTAVAPALQCDLFEEFLEDCKIGLTEKWQHHVSGEFTHLYQIRLLLAAQKCQEQARQCVRVMCSGVPRDEGWNQRLHSIVQGTGFHPRSNICKVGQM